MTSSTPAAGMLGRTYLLLSEADPRDLAGVGRRRGLARPRVIRVVARASFRGGPARSVLVEDLETGARLVRPFRGLRRPA